MNKIFAIFALYVTNISAAYTFREVPQCIVPDGYQDKGRTFIDNTNLSCEANQFLYMAQTVTEKAMEQASAELKSNPIAFGRHLYEVLGSNFATQKTTANVNTKDETVKSTKGAHEIKTRCYESNNQNNIILYIHGGGWTRGNLNTHDALCKNISFATGTSVVAVDYRLAPENRYPAGLNDAQDVLDDIQKKHPNAKIFICGDSGGGNISMALCLKQVQENKRVPDAMLLLYPALDLRIPESTLNKYSNGYLLTRDSINQYVRNYLGSDMNLASTDPLVSPIVASDEILKKLPPVTIISAECDPLAEEGTKFATKLKGLGKEVEHIIIPKVIHIFAQYADVFSQAKDAVTHIKNAFVRYKK